MKRPCALMIICLLPLLAHAHGEDKPGPHGGAIQMPGAFHTEALVGAEGSLQVYFLDVNFRPLSPGAFKLEARVELPSGDQAGKCGVKNGRHECRFAFGLSEKSGKLVLNIQKKGGSKAVATYNLPLESKQMEHGHHH